LIFSPHLLSSFGSSQVLMLPLFADLSDALHVDRTAPFIQAAADVVAADERAFEEGAQVTCTSVVCVV
jgi:hypothetical protein